MFLFLPSSRHIWVGSCAHISHSQLKTGGPMQEADTLGLPPNATCCMSFGKLFHCLISGGGIISCDIMLYCVILQSSSWCSSEDWEDNACQISNMFPGIFQTPVDYVYTVCNLLELRDSGLFCLLWCHNSIPPEMLPMAHFFQKFLPEESTLLNKWPRFFFFLLNQNLFSACSTDCMIVWCQLLDAHLFPYLQVGRGILS